MTIELTQSPSRDLFGMPIHLSSPEGHLRELVEMLGAREPHLVVTPNADHFMRFQRDRKFREAYAMASRSIIDGTPVGWIARALGHAPSRRYPGSDFFFDLLACDDRPDIRVFLVGGTVDTCELATRLVPEKYRRARIVGYDAPWGDDLVSSDYPKKLSEAISASGANLVALCLGSPKQEMLYYRGQDVLPPALYIGLGATIEFLTGDQKRAPKWVRGTGLEWLHRMLTDPRRLVRRYLIDDLPVLAFVWRAWMARLFSGASF